MVIIRLLKGRYQPLLQCTSILKKDIHSSLFVSWMNSDIIYLYHKCPQKIYVSFKRWVRSVMKIKHWGYVLVPSPLLPVQLTICCTSSFMHYQFTPTSPRVESCPAPMYSCVRGWNSKPFIMCSLPSGLQPLQNRLREERRRVEGVTRKDRQSTYMYHVCFWICSNCKRQDRRNGRSVYKQIWIISHFFW